jgi:hypothetical protein
MKPFLLSGAILLILGSAGQAQTSAYPFKVAMGRLLFHESIDKQQVKIISSSSGKDAEETVELQIGDAIGRRVDELQEQLEADSTLSDQGKIKYLRNVEAVLQQYANYRGKNHE